MRYLTVAADYTGSCIRDDFQGQVDCNELQLAEELCKDLHVWNADYKAIIPLDMDDRNQIKDEISQLDKRGMFLAKKIADAIQGGAKVKYFSEGELKLLEMETDQ